MKAHCHAFNRSLTRPINLHAFLILSPSVILIWRYRVTSTWKIRKTRKLQESLLSRPKLRNLEISCSNCVFPSALFKIIFPLTSSYGTIIICELVTLKIRKKRANFISSVVFLSLRSSLYCIVIKSSLCSQILNFFFQLRQVARK